MGRLNELWRDESGVMTAETALLVALCVLASIAAWNRLAGNTEKQVNETAALFGWR